MHVIIERDNGRIEQVIADAPMNVYIVDTGNDKHTGEPLTTLPSGEDGRVHDLPVIVDAESVLNILHTFTDGSMSVQSAPEAAQQYVVTSATATAQEKGVHLGDARFYPNWKEAREAAFERFLGNVEIDTSAHTPDQDDDAPTEEDLDAQYPLDRPQNFELRYASDAGSWMVGVTAIPS